MLPIWSVLLLSLSRGKWWSEICWMTRKLAWTDEAWGDYLYWQGQDKKNLVYLMLVKVYISLL
ncbi:hypothetical protein QUB13_12000 [Microcoleus sp. B4-D4]